MPDGRVMREGRYRYVIGINQNDDGSYMRDKQGQTLPGASNSSGSVDLNDTHPEAWRPRFHDIWERKMGHRKHRPATSDRGSE